MSSDLTVWIQIIGFAQVIIAILLSVFIKIFHKIDVRMERFDTWAQMYEKTHQQTHDDLKGTIGMVERRKGGLEGP